MHQEQCIKDNLYYVGAGDRRQRLFENAYPIPHGMSYNSYLILDEKTILFDSVDRSVEGLFFENLEATLGDRHLDYLVITHMEPDHAATLGDLLNMHPDMMIVGNAKIKAMIGQFFDFSLDHRFHEVKEGDTLSTGEHTFKFFFAPMVHWPEVMMVYDEKIKTLFSSDAFGSFGALAGNIFADELNYESEWLAESRRYYTNIVGKYGMQVQNVFKKLKDTAINMIVPLHGPIWRTPEDINYLLDLHNKWSTSTPEKDGVVLVYGSMYGNTENTINCIANKLAQKGVKDIKVFDVSKTHPSYIISEAWKYSNLVLAAPTYNTGLYLVMDSLLHELASLGYQNRKVSLIGNHTWATGALGAMKKKFEAEFKKVEVVGEPLDVKSALRPEQEEVLDNLTEAIVESMN